MKKHNLVIVKAENLSGALYNHDTDEAVKGIFNKHTNSAFIEVVVHAYKKIMNVSDVDGVILDATVASCNMNSVHMMVEERVEEVKVSVTDMFATFEELDGNVLIIDNYLNTHLAEGIINKAMASRKYDAVYRLNGDYTFACISGPSDVFSIIDKVVERNKEFMQSVANQGGQTCFGSHVQQAVCRGQAF